jgi:hypothetical protein
MFRLLAYRTVRGIGAAVLGLLLVLGVYKA